MRALLKSMLRWFNRLAIGAGVVALALLIWVYAAGGVESSSQADCIVVPGAAIWPNRQPSDALLYRLERTVELYEQGRAPTVIVTGGGEGNFAEAVVMGEWLTAHGLPPEAVIVENESATTRDSGVNVARLMKREGMKTALVVSQWFHVARTRMCLEQEGIETFAAPSSGRMLGKEPYFVGREMVALPAYALRLDEMRG